MVKVKKQKVRIRKKKTGPSQKNPSRFKATGKFIITVLLVGGIGMALVRFKYMFVDSKYFMIKGVEVRLFHEDGSFRSLSLKIPIPVGAENLQRKYSLRLKT